MEYVSSKEESVNDFNRKHASTPNQKPPVSFSYYEKKNIYIYIVYRPICVKALTNVEDMCEKDLSVVILFSCRNLALTTTFQAATRYLKVLNTSRC